MARGDSFCKFNIDRKILTILDGKDGRNCRIWER
jgi:hypothetical protein